MVSTQNPCFSPPSGSRSRLGILLALLLAAALVALAWMLLRGPRPPVTEPSPEPPEPPDEDEEVGPTPTPPERAGGRYAPLAHPLAGRLRYPQPAEVRSVLEPTGYVAFEGGLWRAAWRSRPCRRRGSAPGFSSSTTSGQPGSSPSPTAKRGDSRVHVRFSRLPARRLPTWHRGWTAPTAPAAAPAGRLLVDEGRAHRRAQPCAGWMGARPQAGRAAAATRRDRHHHLRRASGQGHLGIVAGCRWGVRAGRQRGERPSSPPGVSRRWSRRSPSR